MGFVVTPIPLAMKLPGALLLVVVVEPPLELLLVEFRAPDPVVLALTVAGPIVLVWPLTIMKLADGPSEYVVPEIVTAGPPGVSVVPGPMTTSVVPSTTVAEYVWPFRVRIAAAVTGPGLSVEVTPLTTMTEPEALAGRLYTVPLTVSTPPGVRVVPGPTMNSVVPPTTVAATVWPLMVRRGAPVITGLPGAGPRVWVAPFTTAMVPEGPRLSTVPETVIAGPPGVRVCVPKTNWPLGPAVTDVPPTVSTGLPGAVGPAGLTAIVLLPPTTMLDPPGGTDTITPLIVVAWPGWSVCEPMTMPPGPPVTGPTAMGVFPTVIDCPPCGLPAGCVITGGIPGWVCGGGLFPPWLTGGLFITDGLLAMNDAIIDGLFAMSDAIISPIPGLLAGGWFGGACCTDGPPCIETIGPTTGGGVLTGLCCGGVF